MSEEDHYSEIYALICRKIRDNSWQNIKYLDLSNNGIVIIPKELGTLPCLQELDLSNNLLGLSVESTWLWLDQQAVQNNLYSLDISTNYFEELPVQIGKLRVLMMLNVYDNMLKTIPQSIGFLKSLEFLDLSDNMLLYLPGSMNQLNLQYLNISKNTFETFPNDLKEDLSGIVYIESLSELAARCIIKHGIEYNSLPLPLIKYLENAKCCCECGGPCFESYTLRYALLQDSATEIPTMMSYDEYDVYGNIYVEYCCCCVCIKLLFGGHD